MNSSGPVIHIINTGRELMLGRRLNSHAQWLCDQLCRDGYEVARQVCVDDSASAIASALRDALRDAELILTTGGLGPTGDDRTRDVVAQLFGRPLQQDPAVVEHIRSFFSARRRACPERVLSQALVPDGARVLMNPFGTAPGLAIELPPAPPRAAPTQLILLPGPPRELRPMFLDQVQPLLRNWFPLSSAFAYRVLRTTGLGESLVEDKIGPLLEPLETEGLEVGYCAHPGEVDIHLLARSPRAGDLVLRAESRVRAEAGPIIFGTEGELLEEVIVRLLRERNARLAVAESCTGGLIAHRLTNVPGASEIFHAGYVTYSNQAKVSMLGVNPSTLSEHGAVSKPAVLEMVRGARDRSGAQYALAVSGIAGPGGGSEDKPVGTVVIGLATPSETSAKRFLNPYDRPTFKYVTSQQALEWLRQALLAVER